MPVLAIDQGTTSTRAMILEDDGATSLAKTVTHQQHYPQSGWVEHDPEELMRVIRGCIEDLGHVSAIGIDNQGESCLAWHADTKEALTRVIVWQDTRTLDTIDRLKDDGVEDFILEKTGLPLDPYFSASKLGWVVRNIPDADELLNKGKLRLGTTDAFFLDRLTGQCVTDITTASRTSLMNLQTGMWDSELCEVFGVPQEALPEIVSTTGDFGTVDAGNKKAPITASIVDQQASLYGHGCRATGDAKVTFGTGAFALTLTGEHLYQAPEKGLLPTVAWQLSGEKPVYALDGGIYCASSALNWARSLGLFNSFDDINAFEGPAAIEQNLAFVPALTGLACPHWDRSATGLWIGLSLDTTPEMMVQAILEGVAFRAAEVLNAMDEYAPLGGSISIDGGMTVNPYFCQFLANILERTVEVPELSELTAFGTAMLARQDQGKTENVEGKVRVYQPSGQMGVCRQKFDEAIQRSKNWQDRVCG